jgi:hypothetical protein
MREGLYLTLRVAFRRLRLHRLEANIQPAKARSVALVKSLAFRLEGFSQILEPGFRLAGALAFTAFAVSQTLPALQHLTGFSIQTAAMGFRAYPRTSQYPQ